MKVLIINESASITDLKNMIINLMKDKLGAENAVINGSLARYLHMIDTQENDIKIPVDIDIDWKDINVTEESLTKELNRIFKGYNESYVIEKTEIKLHDNKKLKSIRYSINDMSNKDEIQYITHIDIFLKKQDFVILTLEGTDINVIPTTNQIVSKMIILSEKRLMSGRRKDLTELYIYSFYKTIKASNIISFIKKNNYHVNSSKNFLNNKNKLKELFDLDVKLGNIKLQKGVTFQNIFNRVYNFLKPIIDRDFNNNTAKYWDASSGTWK